ncbi:Solute carrier organic anion transporter family member 3A1 [Anabarilius grahami]|uniref:Solute carrier organic anion transporter family member 3A1 n=1 Tax=Anabarilius grahami TaxID=495550 RepID=A0A3N0YAF1_ANAGA|nr:Solute carrier organic anion transporter family member 3A1 [Anabarilius grahami]
MQVKKQRGSEDPQRDDKKPSCFSNIKIFLVAECALMLAQGTVGAYLWQPMCPIALALMYAERPSYSVNRFQQVGTDSEASRMWRQMRDVACPVLSSCFQNL